jgi:hypothetical protein
MMEDMGGDGVGDWVTQNETWGQEGQGKACLWLDAGLNSVNSLYQVL